jgi:poly(beta-D-mannuronate) lyase
MRVALLPCALLACLTPVLPARGAEHVVSSADEIARLAPTLTPGDAILLKDGTWTDQRITLKAIGTAEQPIMLRAQTPGKVILTGASSLTIDGEYVVVAGLHLKDFNGDKDGIAVPGAHCRLTQCAVENGTTKFFVHLIGLENRMDHCYLAGKTSGEPTLQIEAPPEHPDNDVIEYNHFGHRPPLGRNGGETMRVGYSWQSMNVSRAAVEHNLFDRCDGEIEIISSKSCENVYRYNTFLDCDGMLTLRHGNRCVVDSNFFIGHHKHGSGGVRVIGEDHVITNNYIDGIDKGAFWITAGVPNSELKQYFQAKRCVIAFNTVVDSAGPYLDLSAGLGSSGRTLKPQDITIANNVFSVGQRGTLLKGDEGEGWHWMGNIASGVEGIQHAGIRVIDPKLTKAADGLWRPSPGSPVRGAAEGEFPQVKTDIDGQRRTGKWDVGCDQLSTAPVVNRPLTAADVGPDWMPRTAGEPANRP